MKLRSSGSAPALKSQGARQIKPFGNVLAEFCGRANRYFGGQTRTLASARDRITPFRWP